MSQRNDAHGSDDFNERAIPTVPKPRTTSENTAKGRIPRQTRGDQPKS